jgi:RING-like zinc finger
MSRIASRHLDVASIFQLPTITYQDTKPTKIVSSCKEDGDDKGDTESSPPKTICFNEQSQQLSWIMVDDMPSITKEISSTRRGHRLQSFIDEDPSSSDDVFEEETKEEQQQQQQSPGEICVICLEQFIPGDRLRVLPCHHAFHIRCIDPWLSGSHSFADCYTAGCPTCKKHPTTVHDPMITNRCNSSSNFNIPTSRVRNHYHPDWSTDSMQTKTSSGIPSNDHEWKDEPVVTNYMEESTDGSVPAWAFAQLGVSLVRESSFM